MIATQIPSLADCIAAVAFANMGINLQAKEKVEPVTDIGVVHVQPSKQDKIDQTLGLISIAEQESQDRDHLCNLINEARECLRQQYEMIYRALLFMRDGNPMRLGKGGRRKSKSSLKDGKDEKNGKGDGKGGSGDFLGEHDQRLVHQPGKTLIDGASRFLHNLLDEHYTKKEKDAIMEFISEHFRQLCGRIHPYVKQSTMWCYEMWNQREEVTKTPKTLTTADRKAIDISFASDAVLNKFPPHTKHFATHYPDIAALLPVAVFFVKGLFTNIHTKYMELTLTASTMNPEEREKVHSDLESLLRRFSHHWMKCLHSKSGARFCSTVFESVVQAPMSTVYHGLVNAVAVWCEGAPAEEMLLIFQSLGVSEGAKWILPICVKYGQHAAAQRIQDLFTHEEMTKAIKKRGNTYVLQYACSYVDEPQFLDRLASAVKECSGKVRDNSYYLYLLTRLASKHSEVARWGAELGYIKKSDSGNTWIPVRNTVTDTPQEPTSNTHAPRVRVNTHSSITEADEGAEETDPAKLSKGLLKIPVPSYMRGPNIDYLNHLIT